MTSIEDRVRAAAEATAARVRQVRPLELPAAAPATPRRRLPRPADWRGWLIPLAAATAIIAVAALLVALHKGQNDSGHPPATSSQSPASPQPQPSAKVTPACGGPAVAAAPQYLPSDVPPYFVEVCGSGKANRLVAADTRTGAVLGSVPAPSGTYQFPQLYGAGDGQTFLVVASDETRGHPGIALWVLRLAPGTAHPLTLTKLPWELRISALSMAVSPDGTKIALYSNGPIGSTKPVSLAQVYSLSNGALLRTWTTTGLLDSMQWTGDGSGLAYQLNSSTFAVRDMATPGSALATGSTTLVTFSSTANPATTACGGESDWAISADGTTLICPDNGATGPPPGGSCPSQAQPVQLGFVRFGAHSTLPGTAPVGTDYSVTLANPCGTQDTPDTVALWWACSDGTEVIGQVSYAGHDEVGIFYDGTYIPMPALGRGPSSPLMIAF
jgi:hypothetical protein